MQNQRKSLPLSTARNPRRLRIPALTILCRTSVRVAHSWGFALHIFCENSIALTVLSQKMTFDGDPTMTRDLWLVVLGAALAFLGGPTAFFIKDWGGTPESNERHTSNSYEIFLTGKVRN